MLKPVSGGFDAFCGFGVALDQTAPCQFHIGMLFRQANEVQFCDLAFHHLLRHLPASDPHLAQYRWVNSGLEPENVVTMSDFAAKLALNVDKLPYGFDLNGEAFDQITGQALPIPPGKGFTCASFILAAHRHRGIELLDESSWPVRDEDKTWQQQILGVLREYCERHKIDATEHLEAIQSDVNGIRYRPDEVAGGVLATDIPLTFPEARALADEIVADLISNSVRK